MSDPDIHELRHQVRALELDGQFKQDVIRKLKRDLDRANESCADIQNRYDMCRKRLYKMRNNRPGDPLEDL